jgi:hypothetical protein
MTYGAPAAGKAEVSAKTLGLFAQAQFERCKIRPFDLEDLVLMNGGPYCANIRFTPKHR